MIMKIIIDTTLFYYIYQEKHLHRDAVSYVNESEYRNLAANGGLFICQWKA